jgi:hypothetical protein
VRREEIAAVRDRLGVVRDRLFVVDAVPRERLQEDRRQRDDEEEDRERVLDEEPAHQLCARPTTTYVVMPIRIRTQ